jgi:hypothetical protein
MLTTVVTKVVANLPIHALPTSSGCRVEVMEFGDSDSTLRPVSTSLCQPNGDRNASGKVLQVVDTG